MKYQHLFAHRVQALADTTIRDTLALAAKPGVISLGGGIPNPVLFPLDRIREITSQLTDAELKQGLQYSGTQGVVELRTQIAARHTTQWGRNISPEQILITTGSQQALDIIAKTFLDPGDSVAIENPSYLAAIAAFNTNAPQFHPFKLNHNGPDLTELTAVVQNKKPKLLYSIPTFQNPTGYVWPQEIRERTLELCEKQHCLIVEDDPYSELYFGTKPPQAIAAWDTNGSVLYLGTFSKTLVPGLRVGYILADSQLIETMTLIKQSMDLHSSTYSQILLSKLLTDENWFTNHLQTVRNFYAQKQIELVELLKTHLPDQIQWNKPEGGLFVWLKIPGSDSRALLKQAVAEGVAFMPGYPFYAGQPDYETIRLTFATANYDQLSFAIEKLGKLYSS